MGGSQLDDEAIFCVARKVDAPEARAEYLRQACGADQVLFDRVVTLLRVHEEDSSFLEAPAICRGGTAFLTAVAEMPGAQVGPYKLLEQIGLGGMGLVFMAEQQWPMRRMVALKIIKPGMDTSQVIARFEAERQALALMDHPNIAKVHDAGKTESGRPFFVMELVRGLPITDYCDRASVKLRERLALFVKVCQAVEHAHQKGVIHRDLKPSNLMVTLHDGVPVPKVIDFGVAKAINQRLTDQTLFTNFAQMIGTPTYMSPEQAELSGLDVDTRSDVYSLGVLLYELLTGTTPFDKETLSNVGNDEMRRMIREDEPPRPSQRIETLGTARLSTISEHRGLDPRRLTYALRGDLDWIVVKALEKDRTRRYAAASALAADVQRYLDDQPVEARPPTAGYRLRKFVRRKRGKLTTIAALAAVLVTGIISAAVIVVVKDREGREIARIRVPDGSSVTFTDEKKTAESRTASRELLPGNTPLSGFVPSPQGFRGIERWQLITRSPRAFVHHNWKLVWSPNSQFIAFGDGDDVRVYSVPGLQLVHVLAGHTNSVISVDWSPDGRQIASSSSDNSIRLWDADTGVPGPVLVGHRDRVDAVAWHPDSRRLASGSRDNTVRLWTKDGTTGPVLRGHTEHVNSVAWNAEGTRLASAGEGDGIRLWDVDGKLETVIDYKRLVRTIAWSPDGKQLLASQFASGEARTWNLDGTTGLVLAGHTDQVVAAAWSPDGTQIASASWDNTARLWNADGTPGPILRGHDGDVYSVKWSPDGKLIATGGGDRSIRLWTADGRPGPVLHGARHASSVSWRPDGRKFAASLGDHTIRICDSNGGGEKVLEGHTRPVSTVAWSPDGRQIVSGCVDGKIFLWEVDAGTVGADIAEHHTEIRCVSWSPGGREIAFTSTGPPKVYLRNADGTGALVFEGHLPFGLYEVAWSPLGEHLASVGMDGTVRVWSAAGMLEKTLNVGELLASVAWKPDDTQLASGCDNGTIQLWHPAGRPVRLLKGHSDRVISIDWSGDGRRIASGSRDNTIRLWTADGEPLAVFRGHNNPARSVRWRPHTAQILSAGEDATIRLWNADTQRAEWILIMLSDKQSLKFSPEGRLLNGDANVFERQLAYIIEKATGAMEIVPPSEFERRKANAK